MVEAGPNELDAAARLPHLAHCFSNATRLPPAARVSKAIGTSPCACSEPPASAREDPLTDCHVVLAVTVSSLLAWASPKDKHLFVGTLRYFSVVDKGLSSTVYSGIPVAGGDEEQVGPGGGLAMVDSFSMQEFTSTKSEVLVLRVCCSHALRIAHTIARHPQVVWVEQLQQVRPLNQWATSVCQSGKPDLPLLLWSNVTGTFPFLYCPLDISYYVSITHVCQRGVGVCLGRYGRDHRHCGLWARRDLLLLF